MVENGQKRTKTDKKECLSLAGFEPTHNSHKIRFKALHAISCANWNSYLKGQNLHFMNLRVPGSQLSKIRILSVDRHRL